MALIETSLLHIKAHSMDSPTLAVTFLLFAAVPYCFSAEPTAKEQPLNKGVVIANGATSPQLISNETAYEVFFNTVAAPSLASAHELWSHRDKFARAQLSSADIAIVQQVLASFYDKRTALEQERIHTADPSSVDSKWLALIANTRAELQGQLSSVGKAQLDAHIEHLKSRIKLVAPTATN